MQVGDAGTLQVAKMHLFSSGRQIQLGPRSQDLLNRKSRDRPLVNSLLRHRSMIPGERYFKKILTNCPSLKYIDLMVKK